MIVYSPVISGPSKGTVSVGDPNVFRHPIYFFGDRGDTTVEELASIGINKSGADYIIGMFGSTNSTRVAVRAIAASGYTVWATSTTGEGLYGESTSGYGVRAESSSASALYAKSSTYYGVEGISTDSYGVKGKSTNSFGGLFVPTLCICNDIVVVTPPYLSIHNKTNEDGDGERETEIRFRGDKSGGESRTMAIIQTCHDGAADDDKGKLRFMVNDGDDVDSPTEQMNIDNLGIMSTKNHYPLADDTYYLGRNDDDSPLAWKGLILKDQGGTGKYYRLEVNGDALQIVDLTD